MSGDGRNFIAIAAGRKWCGKSHALALMARHFRRRIVYDFVGEYTRRGKEIPGAIISYTTEEALRALHALRRKREWTLVHNAEPDSATEVLDVLMPVGRPEKAFTVAVGGVVMECGEIDILAPNSGKIAASVRSIFQRGRHYGVSMLGATQRPRDMHRVCTSQADVLLAFQQHESIDADYFGKIMGPSVPRLLKHLPPREYLQYKVQYGTLEHVNANGTHTPITETSTDAEQA